MTITLDVLPIKQVEIDVGVVTEGGGALPYYKGSYDVTPDFSAQTLPTKNKSMSQDLIIEKIPMNEVSNPFGTTFILGGI